MRGLWSRRKATLRPLPERPLLRRVVPKERLERPQVAVRAVRSPPRDVRARGAAVRVVPGLRVVHRRARGPLDVLSVVLRGVAVRSVRAELGRDARRVGAAVGVPALRRGAGRGRRDGVRAVPRARRRRRGGRDLRPRRDVPLRAPGPAPAARDRPEAAAQADRGRRGGRRGAELLHRRGELRRRASAAPEVRDVAR